MRRVTPKSIAHLAYWLLWVLCVCLVLPVLIGVPGRPETWELLLYLATVGAVAGYALALPILMVGERKARRDGLDLRRLVAARRVLAGFVMLIMATVVGLAYAHEAARPVLTREEYFANSFSNAILREDTAWMGRLLEEGGNVDQPLDLDDTPASFAANSADWAVVAYLLEHGADPDHVNKLGETVRSLARKGRLNPRDPGSAAALARVRARLDRQPSGE